MEKILITGISGMLGSNLAYYFRDNYDVVGLYNSFPVENSGMLTIQCDLQDKKRVASIIKQHQPDIIIHCASLTDVDYCEANKDEAYYVNVTSSYNLCQEIDKQKMIFISSDSVYGGIKNNYKEEEISSNPKNYYGYTKLKAEKCVSECDDFLILRTNIFGWNVQDKNSIGEWIVYELQNNREINGFKDAEFSTIYTMELARIIEISIIKKLKGVYNCASADYCSKYEFAVKLAAKFGLNKASINEISIDDFQFKAVRGKKLSLDYRKIDNALNYRIPSIDYSVDQFYRDFQAKVPEKIKSFNKKTVKNNFINYGRQWINSNDLKAVKDVLLSGFLTQGPKTREFEERLAPFCSAGYAVAVNSGTAALHIACLAAGISNGDEVITSPVTFVASANCVVYCGGVPVFADIDKQTYNLSPTELEKKITSKTKAVIPVHFAGQSCEMEKISAVIKKAEKKFGHKIFIIEDACHALGSKYNDKMVGSSEYSDMTVMSFHPVKHITTGEGGAVLTNKSEVYKKLVLFRSHGITSDVDSFKNPEQEYSEKNSVKKPWYYEQITLGYNYRITDIQCALGLSQLESLPYFIERRRKIVDTYNAAFKEIENIQIPFEKKACNSNFHLYVLQIDFKKAGLTRTDFMLRLKEKKIQTQVHYIPVYKQTFYKERFNTVDHNYDVSENYYNNCISIPLYPAMIDDDINRVVSAIKETVNNKGKIN